MPVKSLILIFLILAGCTKPAVDSIMPEVISKDGIEIKITPSAITLRTCDLLEISVVVTYPRNFKIKLPDSKADYGSFSIYQINQNSPVAINEKLNFLSQVIILEPGLPAVHKLPPLNFTYWNEANIEGNFSSNETTFSVQTSINSDRNKDIEDIITETSESGHTVIYIGSTALILTVLYLLFFTKTIDQPHVDPANEALESFQQLKVLNESDILRKIPKMSSHFLKEKFQLQHLPDNLDVIQKELALNENFKSFADKIARLLNSYNELRYGQQVADKDKSRELFNSFNKLFVEIQK